MDPPADWVDFTVLHRPPVAACPLTLWLARPASAGERELFFEARYECAARDETLPLRRGQLLMLSVLTVATVEAREIEEAGERWVRLDRALVRNHARGAKVVRWVEVPARFPASLEFPGFAGNKLEIGVNPFGLEHCYDSLAPPPPIRLEFSDTDPARVLRHPACP